MSALNGLKVVDLTTGIAGPLAAMFFADHGADVVKIEPPSGDPGRDHPGFQWFNRGKRSILTDDRERITNLVTRADVVVCVRSEDAGLSIVDGVVAENPRLVVLEVPPWEGEPPWPGGGESAELLSASVGLAWNQTSFAGGPVELVEPQVLYVQGAWGAGAAVAALIEREKSGLGQRVRVSGVHAFVEFGPHLLVFDPTDPPARRDFGPGGPNPTYTCYRSADDLWVFVGALGHKFQRRFLHLLDLDAVLDDPRIAQDPDQLFTPENYKWVRARIEARFADKPRAYWLEALEQADVPSSPLLQRDEWFDHEHVKAIGARVQVQHPRLGPIDLVGPSMVLEGTPARIERPAPEPGENGMIDRDWPAPTPVTSNPLKESATYDGPLAGLKVLSLGAYVAGPYSARLLGELGADVVKVEAPQGDPWRMHGFQVNLGMRGLALDVTKPDGRAAFLDLVRTADVVMDNFRPGVLQRLGIDDASLRAVNPDVITVSVTGFSEGGPMSNRPGFDPVLQAISGMQTAQGGADEPVVLSFAVNDTATAALTALATSIALYHRCRTGRGQRVHTSLVTTALFLQGAEMVRYEGRVPARVGARDYRGPDAGRRYYRCADGWIRLQATEWDPATVDGVDPDLVTRDPVAALTGVFGGVKVEEALVLCERAGAVAVRVRNARDLVADPVLMEAELAHRIERPDGYVYYAPGRLALLSRTMRRGPAHPPGVGEHSTEVLAEAGVTPAGIARLIGEGLLVQGSPVQPRVLTAYR